MAKILLAWELGGGLGHAGRLKPVAEMLSARGHQVGFALRDLYNASQVLKDAPWSQLQAPLWMHRTANVPVPQGNMAEILLGCGYHDAQSLGGLVRGWRDLMRATHAELVVVDYGPSAVLAARSLNLTSVCLSTGMWTPPDASPLPGLRDWENPPPQRLAQSEATVLRAINGVLSSLGAAPMANVAQALRGDFPVLCSWPEMDHYGRNAQAEGGRWFGPSAPPEGGLAPQWPAGDGAKVVAYLRGEHPDHGLVLKALVDLGCRTECYMPEVASGKPPPLTHALIHYAAGPIDLGLALSDGARLCVHHAGQGTMAQSLRHGVPQLLLPMQGEQFLGARQVGRCGAGINAAERPRPPDFRSMLKKLLSDDAFAQAAAAVAQRYRDYTPQKHLQAVVDEIENHLPRQSQLQ